MKLTNLVLRWLSAVALNILGLLGFVSGILVSMTIIGIVPGVLMLFGGLAICIAGAALVAPEFAGRLRARRDGMLAVVVKTKKV